MDKPKNLTVTQQLIVDRCQQIIRFAEETQRAIDDKEKHRKLATITNHK